MIWHWQFTKQVTSNNSYNYRDGIQSHFVMQEKFATFSKTFTVPQTSKYHASLDRTLLRIVQAGLAEKYKKDELVKAASRSRDFS